MNGVELIAALAIRPRQPVVAPVAIELQDDVERLEERPGVFAAAIGGVKIDNPGRITVCFKGQHWTFGPFYGDTPDTF